MTGWVATILAGLVLGVTSYWHGRAGGAGTSSAVFEVVLLLVLVAFTSAGVWAGKR